MSSDAALTENTGPLKGLRVLDVTSVLMGPYASQILGEMGADIVKIEAPAGDVVRLIGPALHEGMGPVFLNTNRSKRSITLDLKHPAGRATLLRLAEDADICLYNVRPQAMSRLGLGYEELRAVNPGIIYVGVFGYGQDGPYAARPAYDDLIQGASTLASLAGRASAGAPRYTPLAVVDRITGMAAVNATLAALYERNISGEGQRIDVPMFENMVGFVLLDHLSGLSFDPPLDNGGYNRLLSPGRRPYKTRDGYICAMVYTNKQWRNFYRILGREEELGSDPRMTSLATRTQYIDEIYLELEEIMSTRTTSEWLALLEKADIPATRVNDLASIFADEHLNAIGYFGSEEHPTEGKLRTLRHPNKWSRTQPKHTRRVPVQGEHGHEILKEAGFSDAEIESLAEQGALGFPQNTNKEAIF